MLQDRQQAQGVARLLDPLVRAVDGVVGEKVAMLVEVEYEGALLLTWAGSEPCAVLTSPRLAAGCPLRVMEKGGAD